MTVLMSHPTRRFGAQPCFEGTSFPVDALFVNLAAGERLDIILNNSPPITREAPLVREACRLIRDKTVEAAC
jgi:uncharacterized protein (DUF433 family)